MIKIYDEKDLFDLKKQRNRYLFITITLFVFAILSALLIYIFTTRNNLIIMEVLFIILIFLFLSSSAFIGLTFLRTIILRIKLIKSFSLVATKKNEIEGEVEYLQERRKYFGFTFLKIKVNDTYLYIEEGIELPNHCKLIIKKGFVVSYE